MKKIAIVGGGIAGLSTALELTRTPQLRAQHEVTVYQLGWRLGGKLASGRSGPEKKNVEHGLHVWFGFYQNAFRSLRSVYEEWDHDPRGPFQTWQDVVKPRSYTPIGYQVEGEWKLYPQLWFTNSDNPVDGDDVVSTFGVITQLMSALDRILLHPPTHGPHPALITAPVWVDAAYHALEKAIDAFFDANEDRPLGRIADQIGSVAAQFAEDVTDAIAEYPTAILWLLKKLQAWAQQNVAEHEAGPGEALMDWLLVDYVLTILRGLFNPNHALLVNDDLDVINDLEFSEWMRLNGASQRLLDSTLVRVIYETAFQYVEGDLSKPNVEAGTCLRTILRMLFSYKGAMLYEVEGGMGDLVIAPIYEVLKQRGVRFEFFHRLQDMGLDADHRQVETLHFGVQATTPAPYEPLETLDYMPCWPEEPLWDQLDEGVRLRADSVDFESHWCPEPLASTRTLTRGTDFDDVVIAMALGAFKPLNADRSPCQALIDHNPRFRAMVDNLGLVPSQALQLWMDRDLAELGFDYHREHVRDALPALVDGPDPYGIWADMTQVLSLEQWRGNPPRSVHYLCGVLNSELYKHPRADHAVPAQARADVRRQVIDWLEQFAGLYWPGATSSPGTWAIDWQVLHDPLGRSGSDRLEAQYYRANVNPTECCVGTTVNSSKHRLAPGDSGFANVYLAGAWTRTPMNVECVEGAVMSGQLASRAICGFPTQIVGEHWLMK